MANEIDELMSIDPLELTKDPEALDKIIAYYRKKRADAESGIKPKRESGAKLKLDGLIAGMTKKVAPVPQVTTGIKRRV